MASKTTLYELNLLTGRPTLWLSDYSVLNNISLEDMKEYFLVAKQLPTAMVAGDIKRLGATQTAKNYK